VNQSTTTTTDRRTDELLAIRCQLGERAAFDELIEPALPPRTLAAFGAMLVIAASWVGYSAWALYRRPLMHAHRVVAGILATAFSGLFAVATLTAAAMTGSNAVLLAGGLGVVMLAVALGLLVRSHRHRRALLARRDELQRELGDR
jgi:protein-S-isoprenylcysteine O-methyltransferase Ste14